MKILHLNEHNSLKGGVEIYLNGLLPELEAKGNSVDLFFGSGEAEIWAQSGCHSALSDPFLKYDSDSYASLENAIERCNPDLIHVHNVQSPLVVELCINVAPTYLTTHDFRWICPANMFFFKRTQCACNRAGAGVLCFAHTATKHCLTPRPKYARAFYRRATWLKQRHAQLAGVIAPSQGARDRLEKAGWSSDCIRTIPYFCPLEVEDNPRPLPENKTLTFMGRVSPNKGWQAFVRAIGMLPADYEGLMIGNFDAGAQAKVMELAREAHCEERIRLKPWAGREELPQIFGETTVFCFTSLWPETLGIVGLEAMSQGVPVIGSDIGGVPQWLKDGENGMLVPPNNPSSIVQAALSICGNAKLMAQMGRSGIDAIRSDFMKGQHVGRLLEFYGGGSKAPMAVENV